MTPTSWRVFRTSSSRPVVRVGATQLRTERIAAGQPSERSHGVNSGAEVPESITARRNVLMALWAGRLLGLSGEALTVYAHSQRFLCRRETRLAHMIENDLKRGGVAVSGDEIHAALVRFHRVALHQSFETD